MIEVFIILVILLLVVLFMNRRCEEYFQAEGKKDYNKNPVNIVKNVGTNQPCPDKNLKNDQPHDYCRLQAAQGNCQVKDIKDKCAYTCQPCVADPFRAAWQKAKPKDEKKNTADMADQSCPNENLKNVKLHHYCRLQASRGNCHIKDVKDNCAYTCQPCVADPLRAAWQKAKPEDENKNPADMSDKNVVINQPCPNENLKNDQPHDYCRIQAARGNCQVKDVKAQCAYTCQPCVADKFRAVWQKAKPKDENKNPACITDKNFVMDQSCPNENLKNDRTHDYCRIQASRGNCQVKDVKDKCAYTCQPCVFEPLRAAWQEAKPKDENKNIPYMSVQSVVVNKPCPNENLENIQSHDYCRIQAAQGNCTVKDVKDKCAYTCQPCIAEPLRSVWQKSKPSK